MTTIIADRGISEYLEQPRGNSVRYADSIIQVGISSIPDTQVRRLALRGRPLMLGSSPMQGGRHT